MSLPRASAAFGLLILGCLACRVPTSLRDSTASAPPRQTPVSPAPPPRTEPGEAPAEPSQPAPAPEPLLVPHDDHLDLQSPATVEEFALLPHEVALATGADILRVHYEDARLEHLATGTDLHGLATHGTTLYWIGQRSIESMDMATSTRGSRRGCWHVGPGSHLAHGDVLYCSDQDRALWRLDEPHHERLERDVDLDPNWLTIPDHFDAADRLLVMPIFDRASKDQFLWRVRVGHGGKRIEADGPSPPRWSLHPKTGALLVFCGEEVARVSAKSTRAEPLFAEPDADAVCWCGDDVCTLSSSADEVRVHHRGSSRVRVLAAAGLEPVARLRCDRDVVAWTSRESEDTLHILRLDQRDTSP